MEKELFSLAKRALLLQMSKKQPPWDRINWMLHTSSHCRELLTRMKGMCDLQVKVIVKDILSSYMYATTQAVLKKLQALMGSNS